MITFPMDQLERAMLDFRDKMMVITGTERTLHVHEWSEIEWWIKHISSVNYGFICFRPEGWFWSRTGEALVEEGPYIPVGQGSGIAAGRLHLLWVIEEQVIAGLEGSVNPKGALDFIMGLINGHPVMMTASEDEKRYLQEEG